MELTAGDIAATLGVAVDGDPSTPVTGLAAISEAGPGKLTFCLGPKYAAALPTTDAAAVLVFPEYGGVCPAALIRVPDPYAAFVRILKLFRGDCPPRDPGIHASAIIDATARLGRDVSIGPLCVIEADAVLGDGVTLGPGTYVGPGSSIGAGSYLHPQVTVRENVSLGERVIVHSGTVIGSDGFGYLNHQDGHTKIPQVGSVVIEDDVEIGANSAIDRGTFGATRIGRGVKIDNLVHIAHNVTVGEHSILVAQVGVSGSTRIGHHVTLAGQVGIVGHIAVGDGAQIGAQAGVTKTVPKGSRVSGYPAMEHDRARRLNAYYRRLPNLFDQMKQLEARIQELEREREEIL